MDGWDATDPSDLENARQEGILRGWIDQAYDGYVCDPGADPAYQKQGIGKELLARVAAHYGPRYSGSCGPLRALPATTSTLAGCCVENGECLPEMKLEVADNNGVRLTE